MTQHNGFRFSPSIQRGTLTRAVDATPFISFRVVRTCLRHRSYQLAKVNCDWDANRKRRGLQGGHKPPQYIPHSPEAFRLQ